MNLRRKRCIRPSATPQQTPPGDAARDLTRGGRSRVALFRVAAAAAFLLALSAHGCGLTGGGIPPGGPGPGGGPGPSPFQLLVVGHVQSAVPPYAPLTGAVVSVQNSLGQVVAGPTTVQTDGSFNFPAVPGGALKLNVNPGTPALQPLSLPFASQDLSRFVQFVAAPHPPLTEQPTSLQIFPDTAAPTINAHAQLTAQFVGLTSTPGLAPSWVAFGGSGHLTASGPIASFTAQAPGPETIFAVLDNTTSAVTLTVPDSLQPPPSTDGTGLPPAPPNFDDSSASPFPGSRAR
jgi:hypothetical protein